MTQRFYVYEVTIMEEKSGHIDSTLYDTQTAADHAVESHIKIRRNRGWIWNEIRVNTYELESPTGFREVMRLKQIPVFTR